jgi:hypothetical protein
MDTDSGNDRIKSALGQPVHGIRFRVLTVYKLFVGSDIILYMNVVSIMPIQGVFYRRKLPNNI